MTTVLDTLKQCHSLVWQYRAELEHVWPTPTVEDALLFAFTELGESVDAYLRTKPEYARNNAKELSVLDELADCALMVITAAGPSFPSGIYVYKSNIDHGWTYYVWEINFLMRYKHIAEIETDMMQMVQRIATHPGMDLPARLTSRLEKIKSKRLLVTPPEVKNVV